MSSANINRNRNPNQCNDGGSRRNARRSVSPIPPRCLDNATNDAPSPERKRVRVSPRNLFTTCSEINKLDPKLRCSACVHFKDYGTKPRNQCTTVKCQCYQALERDEKTVEKQMLILYNGIMDHINKNVALDPSALKKQLNTPLPTPKLKTTTTTDDNGSASSPPPLKEVELIEKTTSSNGQEFTFQIPSTHRIVHKNHLKRWHNDSRKLQRVRSKLQSVQCSTQSIFSQALWSIALMSTPALALSAAQCLFP